MNWKVNYWTGLFALTSLAALYFWYAGNVRVDWTTGNERLGQPIGLTTDRPCDAPDDIPDSIALERIRTYQNRLPDSRAAAASPLRVVNPFVRYFHLPRCELNKMLDLMPYGDVYAYLSIKPADQPDSLGTLDLIFSDSLLGQGIPIGASLKRYFDFTSPCPPVCPSSAGIR